MNLGRMYISENNVCYSGGISGDARFIIPFVKIRSISKERSFLGLMANSIKISTSENVEVYIYI